MSISICMTDERLVDNAHISATIQQIIIKFLAVGIYVK